MSIITISVLVILSIVLIILLTSVVRLNAFVSLFAVSLLLAVVTLPEQSVIEVLKQGFGNTMASIGFLIIFGAIIAVVLDQTGGAASIAGFILSKTGAKNAASAMGLTGFIAGMPIFCDSGFIIMSGLARSFSTKAKVALPFVAFVLATSLYSVHCLIPTHPGALAAAGIMEAHLGNLILLGTLAAIPGALAAFWWIKWKTKGKTEELYEDVSNNDTQKQLDLPPVSLSFLPVVVPILLIAVGSLLTVFRAPETNVLVHALVFLGQPVIALLAGVLLSLLLIRKPKISFVNNLIEGAIQKAGPILVVTAAGGMFGLVIKETGIGAYAGSLLLETGLGLAVPFLIAFLLKTAQGSSTVAIITAASFVTPMLPSLGLDSETGKLLTMLAMGAGSMMVSHANDSYFWVVSRFTGISMNTTLKVYSSATAIMGITVFTCVWIASKFMLG
ncbi:Inner membrane permease YgbN [bioreactor metagenome]|jgi:GntP family gluconate:H+ symporter|uniref:Inner membrane permease YgbN n=1 Tax=bioreactor metagenome TaxID=1076179 RepID=A0A644WGX4_9ZZZZ|nr:GntP family permease [Paludibacter sp.]